MLIANRHNAWLDILLAIFCFVLIVDPPNALFKVKDLIFVMLVALCLYQYKTVSWRGVVAFMSVVLIWAVTLAIGVSFYDYQYDFDFSIGMLKAFMPLILLCWIDRLKFFDKITVPSVIIGILSLFVTSVLLWLPEMELLVYQFFDVEKGLIMMSRRSFVGIEVTSAYYRSAPILIIPLCIYGYKFFFERENRQINFLLSLLFLSTLIFAGTRACILSSAFVILLYFVVRVGRIKGGEIVLFFLLITLAVICYIVLFTLLSETTEASNEAKYGHLSSYFTLFSENPSVLLWGQGAGGLFYSSGFAELTTQTEWSYIEMVRYYGIFGAGIIIGIFIYPIMILYYRRHELKYVYPMIFGYIMYLLIGGTNPLLLGSNGMLVLLVIYSYAYQNVRSFSINRCSTIQ